jgi:peptidoglycan hydrolase-like protein with peptidoglycan-binding domain
MSARNVITTLAVAGGLLGIVPAVPAAALPTCNSHIVHDEANVPSVASTGSVDCVMGQGAHSDAVLYLQFSLNYCYGAGLVQDGDFGPRTKAALIEAQRQSGAARDGVYGPETRRKMLHRAIGPIFGCKRVS